MTIYLVGCNNQQMAASNPFMSPDRVPPPATRTIAPGQAAPYYPGDPMPSAQAVPPGAQTTPPITPIGTTMPSPVATQQVTTQQIAPQQAATVPTVSAPTTATPQPLAFSNERNVAIPTDNEQMRFAVPPPSQAMQPQQMAAQAMPSAATNPVPAAAPAPAAQVVPAAFNQPVPAPTTNPDTNGPWRSPQISATNSQVAQAQYVQAQPGQPTMLTAQPVPQTMPVEMRTVPSPQTNPWQVAPQQPQFQQVPSQPQPQQFTAPPRMRFPSWTDPTTWFTPTADQGAVSTQPQPGQQLIGYMVPGPNGQMQMVPLDQYQKMQAGATQQSSAAGSDGFRPRTTTK
jgi:hypothetical protein